MRLWHLFFVLAGILVSTSASASVCARFSTPLTQMSFSGLAGQVKDQFPTDLRPTLDEVRLVVLPTGSDELYASEGQDGFEIAVSETYLSTTCTIALWVVSTKGPDTELGALLKDVQRRICEREADRRACALRQMAEAVRTFEESDANKKIIADIQPILTQVVLSTFRFALAHEYGHVVNDRVGARSQMSNDPETSADLFALSIYAAGRNWPSSDTILFAGRRYYDAVANDMEGAEAPHREALCRALRSNRFRTAVTAPLTAINQWRALQDMEMNLSVLALSGDSLKVPPPPEAAGCLDDDDTGRNAVLADLELLQSWTGDWPKDDEHRRAAIKDLEGRRLSSEFGQIVRSGMLASFASSSTMDTARMVVDSSITSSSAKLHQMRVASFNQRRFGKFLSGKDLQNVQLAKALAQFLKKVSSTGPTKAALQMDRRLADAERLAVPGSSFLIAGSLADIVLGRCQEGMTKMITALTNFQNPLAELGAFSVLSGQEPANSRGLNDEFAKLLSKAPSSLSDQQRQKCLANSEKLGRHLSQVLASK